MNLDVVEVRPPPPPPPPFPFTPSEMSWSSAQLLRMPPGDIMPQSGQMSRIRLASDSDDTARDCHLTVGPLVLWHA